MGGKEVPGCARSPLPHQDSVCHLSLCATCLCGPRGGQWLGLSPCLSPPLPSTHLLLSTREEAKPENDHFKRVF